MHAIRQKNLSKCFDRLGAYCTKPTSSNFCCSIKAFIVLYESMLWHLIAFIATKNKTNGQTLSLWDYFVLYKITCQVQNHIKYRANCHDAHYGRFINMRRLPIFSNNSFKNMRIFHRAIILHIVYISWNIPNKKCIYWWHQFHIWHYE